MVAFATWLGSNPSLRDVTMSSTLAVFHVFQSYIAALADPSRPSSARIFLAAWTHWVTIGLIPVAPTRQHWNAMHVIGNLRSRVPPNPRTWFDPLCPSA